MQNKIKPIRKNPLTRFRSRQSCWHVARPHTCEAAVTYNGKNPNPDGVTTDGQLSWTTDRAFHGRGQIWLATQPSWRLAGELMDAMWAVTTLRRPACFSIGLAASNSVSYSPFLWPALHANDEHGCQLTVIFSSGFVFVSVVVLADELVEWYTAHNADRRKEQCKLGLDWLLAFVSYLARGRLCKN